MVSVPTYFNAPPPASPRVRQLSEELSRVIEEYERRYPDLSASDVQSAARLAVQKRGKGPSTSRQTVALAIGVVAFVGGLAAYLFRQGTVDMESVPLALVMVVAVLLGVVGMAVAIRRRE